MRAWQQMRSVAPPTCSNHAHSYAPTSRCLNTGCLKGPTNALQIYAKQAAGCTFGVLSCVIQKEAIRKYCVSPLMHYPSLAISVLSYHVLQPSNSACTMPHQPFSIKENLVFPGVQKSADSTAFLPAKSLEEDLLDNADGAPASNGSGAGYVDASSPLQEEHAPGDPGLSSALYWGCWLCTTADWAGSNIMYEEANMCLCACRRCQRRGR